MNAELLIMFTLDCDRAYLYAHPERELTADETQRYDEALARRATGVPAQYITGHQEFWGLDLIVSPAVLIPRPETEHVVETVLGLVSGDDPGQSQDQNQRAADRNVRATLLWMWVLARGRLHLLWPKSCHPLRSLRQIFPPRRSKLLAPMRLGMS